MRTASGHGHTTCYETGLGADGACKRSNPPQNGFKPSRLLVSSFVGEGLHASSSRASNTGLDTVSYVIFLNLELAR